MHSQPYDSAPSYDANDTPPPSYVGYWIALPVVTVLFVLALLIWPPYFSGAGAATTPSQFVLFFGRFHPIILHLPVGVLIISLLLEVGCLRERFELKWRDAALFVAFVGVVGVVLAVMFGIFLSREGDFAGKANLRAHQLLCLLSAFASIAGMFTRLIYAVTMKRGMLDATRFMLFATAGLMGIGAHFGGNMSHGDTYLTKYAPAIIGTPMSGMDGWIRSFFEKKKDPKADVEPASTKAATEAKAPASAPSTATAPAVGGGDKLVFQHVVLPVLEAKCNKCHNEAKSKGDLRMDTYELAIKGGENGKNFVAGKPEDSLSVQRMKLPADDDEHMPPDGKEQPTKEEIDLVAWWVKEGASDKLKVSEAKFPVELQATVDALLKK